MESDHEKYIHDIDKVIKRLDFLGNNWENDLDDIQDRIMKGRWWDGLIELLNGSVEMKRLLIISRKIVNTKEEVTSRIEEKLDDLKATTSMGFGKLSESQTIEKKVDTLQNTTVTMANELEKLVKMSKQELKEEVTDRIDTAVASISQRKVRDRNLIMFIDNSEDDNEIDYGAEIRAVFKYLGVEDEYQEAHVIQDGKARNQKIALRIHFDDDRIVSKALAKAHSLKFYRSKVFLARDMSFFERMKVRNLVKLLREKILCDPTHRWKIINGEIVNVGIFKKQSPNRRTPEMFYCDHISMHLDRENITGNSLDTESVPEQSDTESEGSSIPDSYRSDESIETTIRRSRRILARN